MIEKKGCFLCGHNNPGGASFEYSGKRGRICTPCWVKHLKFPMHVEEMERRFDLYDDSTFEPPENYN